MADLSTSDCYRLMISAVVPRPIGLLTTLDATGIVNCAPFSYSSIVSHDPPIVCTSISHRSTEHGIKKDTLVNIETTGEYVFNVVSSDFLQQANQCAGDYPAGTDEMLEAGLATLPSSHVQPPRVAQSRVSLECTLFDTKPIANDAGKHSCTLVLGRVRAVHVRDDVIKRRTSSSGTEAVTVDLEGLEVVGRAGDITYWPVGREDGGGGSLRMPRPKV